MFERESSHVGTEPPDGGHIGSSVVKDFIARFDIDASGKIRRPGFELSPEEKELRDPNTILALTVKVNPETGAKTLAFKKWNPSESEKPGTVYQLLQNDVTEQLVVTEWKPSDIYLEKREEDGTVLKEINQESGYSFVYADFQEAGLYGTREKLDAAIRKTHPPYETSPVASKESMPEAA